MARTVTRSIVPAVAGCALAVNAFGVEDGSAKAPLTDADEAVIVYNGYISTLASEHMAGRLPGTPGMERAKAFVEHYFAAAGLEPGFPDEGGAEFASYRQAFPLGGSLDVTGEGLSGTVGGDAIEFEAGSDFTATGMGRSGEVTGRPVFVGYSVENEAEGYPGFEEGDDLTGQIAVMLRFEPMDEGGRSRWAGRGEWSRRASFRAKLRAIEDLNPAAIIIANPPECWDPRSETLLPSGGGGTRMSDVPVVFMSVDAADEMAKAMDPEGRSMTALKALADEGRTMIEFNGELSVDVTLERTSVMGENVGGVLRGRGELAHEWIVVGGHLDHLGMGDFGSRSGPGKLHPGADDNASGSAGVMLFADMMAESYAGLPEDANLRSVLFACFSGEESGLNGSRYYASNTIAPIEDHVLMMNFDMIGRVQNDRLSVSGYGSGDGMEEWLEPYFDASPLDVQGSLVGNGASDHTSFLNQDVPVIFGIIADFHQDYHTPEDVLSKINRVGAVETIRLFHDIAMGMSQRSERFAFASGRRAAGGGPRMADIKIRFGVMPGNYDEDAGGVEIASVTDGGSAALAGVESGDVLVRWDGQKVLDVAAWMGMLANHEPGDEIKVGVKRSGEELTLDVTLQARP